MSFDVGEGWCWHGVVLVRIGVGGVGVGEDCCWQMLILVLVMAWVGVGEG